MDAFITYQQDTFKVKSLSHSVLQNIELQSITNRKKPVPIPKVSAREQKKTITKTYTPAQIKSWRMRQENKLLLNNLKYITPRTNIDLSISKELSPTFILPIRARNNTNTDWLTIVIFFGIILFASVRYTYAKYMQHLFLSLFNYATSVRMLQEKNYPLFHGAIRLEVIFYLTLSVFIFQALNILKWENTRVTPSSFFVILGMVLLYFFGKKMIYLMLGSMFEVGTETREYLFNMDNVNRSLGLLLLPIVILVSFAPFKTPVFIVLTGIIILIILTLILLQRGIFILLKKQFSIFYLFLYLCTLEFLPLLLIYKIVAVVE